MQEQSWAVTGMTCDHCVRAVTEEVSAVAGVEAVRVDLQTGILSVDSAGGVPEDAVARAVDEAGYALDQA